MSSSRRVDGWDFLTLILWSFFFAAGLVPEPVFVAFRAIADVPTQSAFVNSSAVITLSFALYLAFFVRRRCLDAGAVPQEANTRATQIGLLGVIAFLEIPQQGIFSDGRTLLYLVIRSQDIVDTYLKTVVLAVGTAKIVAWWYLYSLILRYHAFGARNVFNRMVSLFPSAHKEPETPPGPTTADTEEAKPEPSEVHPS